MSEREAVVAAARAYIGTPYRGGAAIRGVGVDCATLLQMAYIDGGARVPFKITPYTNQWHLHNDDPLYESAIISNGGKIVPEPDLGDIVLYFQGRQFAHGAIVSELSPLKIIHAFAPARCVTEGFETEFSVLMVAKKKFYSLW